MAVWEGSNVDVDEGADFHFLSEPEFGDLLGEFGRKSRTSLFATIIITDGPGMGLPDELAFGS